MPHCQKEKHNHQSHSKKEKQKKQAERLARKNELLKAKEDAEKEKMMKMMGGNNLTLKDGFGEYIIGCEEEMEYVAKFNMNKRSKKHLRMDIIKQQQKAEREEEERIKKEQENNYRLEQEKLNGPKEKEEEELGELKEEYLVYICQCCNKKFKTVQQFKNHIESKKHKDIARLYEEAGVIVTDIVLADDISDGYNSYDDDEDEGDEYEGEECNNFHEEKIQVGDVCTDEEDGEEEDEYEYEETKGSAFSAFGVFSDDSTSSSSSSDEDSDDTGNLDEGGDEECCDVPSSTYNFEEDAAACVEDCVEEDCDDDDLDLLEDIIYQNRLQARFYPDDDDDDAGNETKPSAIALAPIAFDDEHYDPDNFDVDRLAAIQHRLQKRLADRGIQPSQIQPGCRSADAISMGKTLLQEVMEASTETMKAKLALYKQHKAEHQLLGREFKFAKGNSKALASQYSYRIDPSDNSRTRANVHHAGSHYHMAAARSMYYGRQKGLMARHSSQGSRLQASRMAAQETANKHSKGMAKVGKTSKKSTQKRRGEAGGSKKSGGAGTASEK